MNNYGVYESTDITNSKGVCYSSKIQWSVGVHICYGVRKCIGINDCRALNFCMFCDGIDVDEYMLFNKKIRPDRFEEVYEKLLELFGNWFPDHETYINNFKRHDAFKGMPYEVIEKRSIKEAWCNMPKKAMKYIKSLSEFDSNIFYEITGVK